MYKLPITKLPYVLPNNVKITFDDLETKVILGCGHLSKKEIKDLNSEGLNEFLAILKVRTTQPILTPEYIKTGVRCKIEITDLSNGLSTKYLGVINKFTQSQWQIATEYLGSKLEINIIQQVTQNNLNTNNPFNEI